jgi:single-strand DNA-binding protein
MANYNKIILAGNLTRDPQLTYLPSQTAVVDFGMAINRKWTGQNGQQKEEVCFVDVRAFGKPAETINHYLAKGRQILIEGRLSFQQWQGQDGSKKSKHIVIAESFQFLGSAPGAQENGASGSAVRPPLRTRSAAPSPSAGGGYDQSSDTVPPPEEDISQETKDDIPF